MLSPAICRQFHSHAVFAACSPAFRQQIAYQRNIGRCLPPATLMQFVRHAQREDGSRQVRGAIAQRQWKEL